MSITLPVFTEQDNEVANLMAGELEADGEQIHMGTPVEVLSVQSDSNRMGRDSVADEQARLVALAKETQTAEARLAVATAAALVAIKTRDDAIKMRDDILAAVDATKEIRDKYDDEGVAMLNDLEEKRAQVAAAVKVHEELARAVSNEQARLFAVQRSIAAVEKKQAETEEHRAARAAEKAKIPGLRAAFNAADETHSALLVRHAEELKSAKRARSVAFKALAAAMKDSDDSDEEGPNKRRRT